MTTLCPAVQEIIHDFIDNSTSEDDKYVQGIKKGATLQAEWERERVKKAIYKHQNCREYHGLNGNELTCLDMVLIELGIKRRRNDFYN